MIRFRLLITALLITMNCASCAVIAGTEDPGAPDPHDGRIRLNYVETLRNQDSLRGEGLREVVHTAGTATTLLRPNSVFADAFRVYVTDQTQPPRIFIFDRGERTASILAVPAAPAEGRLVNPLGIAVDVGKVIYVADAQQGRVFGYDRNGTLLLTFGRTGELAYPAAIAIDNRRNRIHIADSHAHVVKTFSILGDHLFDIRGDGTAEQRLKSPTAISLDREGRIYVLDDQYKRVFLYDADGKFKKNIALTRSIPADSLRPRGIAVDSAGHIYVTDAVNNNILIFESDGSFLKSWGKTGNLNGDFWTPRGLFIDERDTIYIADQTNGRVQVYRFIK